MKIIKNLKNTEFVYFRLFIELQNVSVLCSLASFSFATKNLQLQRARLIAQRKPVATCSKFPLK